jgi:thiamine pyrophosphokinase
MSQVVVVVGGGPLTEPAIDAVFEPASVIAADSGLDVAVAAGLRPTVLVGDLDSLSASGRMWSYAHGVEIHEFPADKDSTDTALALESAVATACTDLLLLAGEVGGHAVDDRLDHRLAVLGALGHPSLARFDTITAYFGDTVVRTVHAGRSCVLEVPDGTLFSLLTLHGTCSGITVTGARWELSSATLEAGSTRGISNVASGEPWITCGDGVLTVVVP